MRESFLSNTSRFGQMMTRLGILIAANLLFLITCMPVVTTGAGLAALHHTMLRTLRSDGEINPFREFFKGFRGNFKQATAAFVILVLLIAFLLLEIFWCMQFTGFVAYFRYGLIALVMMILALALYLFPTMAAFDAPFGKLIAHSFYFLMKNPLMALLIIFVYVMSVLLTIVHLRFRPLYAFLWCVIGASALVMLQDSMLLKLFVPYLPGVDASGEMIPEGMEADFMDKAESQKDSNKTLDDMMKLGM